MADSGSLVNLTWALNETVNGLVAIAKSVLQAANEDNVQPIALLAAEAFGNTLAMAQDSCIRTEKEMRRSHVVRQVKFLNSVIGYSGTDSASQLAKSGPGVRFLALASTLIYLPSYEKAARALELMITSSAGENQIVPTVGQLEVLLKTLEAKLMRLAFGDRVMAWTTRLSHWCQKRGFSLKLTGQAYTCLHERELQALIDVFRRVRRLGEVKDRDEQPAMITITTQVCFPWIIAFIEWCNGVPPKVIIEQKHVTMQETDPLITVKLLCVSYSQRGDDPRPDLKIETFYSFDRLASLWEQRPFSFSREEWTGLISVQNHGQRWIQSLERDGNIEPKAICEALSVSIALTLTAEAQATQAYSNLRFPMLPTSQSVRNALGLFLNREPSQKIMDTGNIKSVWSAPVGKELLSKLRRLCQCAKCSGGS